MLAAVFALAVLIAGLTGGLAPLADAQMIGMTPMFLPAIYSGRMDGSTPGGGIEPAPTATPTLTPTATPTDAPTAVPGQYDQVHLSWVSEPATSLTVVWRTDSASVASAVSYRAAGAWQWQQATGAPRPSGASGVLHQVTLSGLDPDTTYQYRVMTGNGTWSHTFTARTAPAPGPATFDAIFFADTGLIGREDGLATGTEQVIDEIAKMDPLVLLGGGDYAYFDKDKRYGTLDGSIDAWFRQVQPIASRAVLIATYGNHEVDPALDENYDSWAARFATPPGFDGRRNFSVDVGDVHFIALFAAMDSDGVTNAQVEWMEQDIIDAKARGMRWIIPYFHVVMFGDGDVHDEHWNLRGKLGPIFEKHDVQLVMYAHDQAYERSYPLTGVTATSYQTTSKSKTCYTAQDGVVYMKVSPAGKESNVSGHFSPFKSNPAPSWTAVRDNTKHHFARLRMAPGQIVVEAWGVLPNNSGAPVLDDSFKLTTGSCP